MASEGLELVQPGAEAAFGGDLTAAPLAPMEGQQGEARLFSAWHSSRTEIKMKGFILGIRKTFFFL